jgi:hypothetical protein
MIIKCSKFKQKIFRYITIGERKVWHCCKDRIIEDYNVSNRKNIKCKCGNFIDGDKGNLIKLKQHSFIRYGTKIL